MGHNRLIKMAKRAFSLIEISFVLIIIAIAIAGAISAHILIDDSKISSAASLTKNSGIEKIENLVAWFETTRNESFLEDEREDGSAISVWYDLNSSSEKQNATQNTESQRPIYLTNCINGLPCVQFDGTNDLLGLNLDILRGTDYTIFLVEQRRSATSSPIIGSLATIVLGNALALGYNSDGDGMFSHGDESDYYKFGTSPAIAPYSGEVTSRLHTFLNPTQKTGSSTVYHYLNGNSSPSTLTAVGSPSFGAMTAYVNAAFGAGDTPVVGFAHYNGDIGEIIIYNRALETYEREAVENYLLKKWKITSL